MISNVFELPYRFHIYTTAVACKFPYSTTFCYLSRISSNSFCCGVPCSLHTLYEGKSNLITCINVQVHDCGKSSCLIKIPRSKSPFPMGDCLSCFKAPPSPSLPPDTMSSEKEKEDVRSVELQRLTPIAVETHLNGNSKPIIEKPCRSFCSLLPGSLSREKEVSEAKINNLFESYKESNKDVILADGIEKLCSDLGLSPDEYRVLLLAWRLNAEQMCQFTRTEFLTGFKAMHVDSIKGIQQRLSEIASDVSKDHELFKDLYRFTFRFGLDATHGQRILPSDMAVCLWRLVFTGREPLILSRWLNFLESHPHVRGIPRDTWNMFLNFAETVGDDLSSYDDTEAWPSLFDDFVEFENDAANQNVSKDKVDGNVIKEDY